MANKSIVKILAGNNLRVTPQRIAVLEAVLSLEFHPTAEDVVDLLRINYPSISMGTVYKNLEIFVKKGLLGKIKTNNEIIRYDNIKDFHHHLVYTDSESIIDYFDPDLNQILDKYFSKKKIPGFHIDDYKLQITGHKSNEESANGIK